MRLTKAERDYLRRIHKVASEGRAMLDYNPVLRLTLERKSLLTPDGRLTPAGEREAKAGAGE